MKPDYPPRAIAFVVCCCIFAISFAQSRYEGDMLLNALGKTDESSELSNLKASYNFQMANENHFLSKDGIELVLQNSALSEIKLYQSSTVYGNFKGQLPRGLSFGLTPAEVKSRLGKPSTSYNTGYCEFEVQGQIISCWFEKDHLSQVDLGLK
jgi:hypothetical protein